MVSNNSRQGTAKSRNEHPGDTYRRSEPLAAVAGRASQALRMKDLIADKPVSWLLTVVIPIAVYLSLAVAGVKTDLTLFVTTITITLLMWVFSLMADFIPALLAVLILLLFGVAPQDVVLSGFSSPGFLLALSVMGLGVVVTESGLTYRYALFLVNRLPSNTFFHQLAVFFTAFIFNPIVPTITGRAILVAPIMKNIVAGWDDKTKEKSSTLLYSSGLDGINYLSPIFLTAAPANFMIFGLLPPQEQQAFQFVFWFYAAALTGFVMTVLYFFLAAVFFRAYRNVEVEQAQLRAAYEGLGSMTLREWISLVGILVLAVGIGTTDIHKISIPIIAFGVMCVLLLIGALSREDFIKRIDWSFLFFLGGIIGLLSTMNYLHIDRIIMDQLTWVGEYMREDFQLFVLMLTGTMLVVRLFIPLNSAIVIFAAALLPLANGVGVSPWLIGFIILILAETAFFGYQSPYILFFRNLTKDAVAHDELKVQIFHGLLLFAKLAAIYASIPFWNRIGIL